MNLTDTIRAMRAAGVPDSQILDTVLVLDAGNVEIAAGRKERDRLRKRAERANKQDETIITSKMSIGQARTGADNADTSSPKVFPHTPFPNPNTTPPYRAPPLETQTAFEAFCEAVANTPIPMPKTLTADRRRRIQSRLSEHGLAAWREACRNLAASPFCRGENDRGWKADLDFLCQPKSFNRLLEGTYNAAHSPPRLVEDDAQWARRLRYARTNSRWSTAEWGPLPGTADSRVPGHLVEAGDGNGWQELENAA